MSKEFAKWTVAHLATLSQLPDKLEKGRAYFIEDEGYFIIDHGKGPVIYGNNPGPQGMAGEPIPQLQDQIDYLTEATLRLIYEVYEIDNRRKSQIEAVNDEQSGHVKNLIRVIEEKYEELKDAAEQNAAATLSQTLEVQRKFAEYDKALNILSNAIATIRPEYEGDSEEGTREYDRGALSVGEILTTSDGTQITISDAYVEGDTQIYVLDIPLEDAEKAPLLYETLNAGDTVKIGGDDWTVENIRQEGDTSIIEISL